jgi:hypothetical protein
MNFIDVIPSVVCAEGSTKFDMKTTENIYQGKCFSSIGPEMFVNFTKYMKTFDHTTCIVIKPMVRDGTTYPIKIMGTYKEWLLYFA